MQRQLLKISSYARYKIHPTLGRRLATQAQQLQPVISELWVDILHGLITVIKGDLETNKSYDQIIQTSNTTWVPSSICDGTVSIPAVNLSTPQTCWLPAHNTVSPQHPIVYIKYTSICTAHFYAKRLKCAQTWITQFYLQITPCLPLLPSRRTSPPFGWYSFYRPTKGRRLSRPGWLVTYRNKVPPPGVEPGHGHPSQY